MSSSRYPIARRGHNSQLTPALRAWLAAAMALSALVFASTLYLLADRAARQSPGAIPGFSADRDAPPAALTQVVGWAHAGAGLLVAAMLLVFAAAHLPRVWNRRQAGAASAGLLLVVIVIIVAATGMVLFPAAADRNRAWVWWLHAASAALAPAAYLWHRSLSHVRPRPGALLGFGGAVAAASFALLLVHGVVAPPGDWRAAAARDAGDVASIPPAGFAGRTSDSSTDANAGADSTIATPPLTATAGLSWGAIAEHSAGLRSRLQPARVAGFLDGESVPRRADEIAATRRREVEYCGRCHADAVEQWSASAHRFAARGNPFYEAALQEAQRTTAVTGSAVDAGAAATCYACHEPALRPETTDAVGADHAAREAGAAAAFAMDAITCSDCHGAAHESAAGPATAAGEPALPGAGYLFADAPAGSWRALLHNAALGARPAGHQRDVMSAGQRTSRFCLTCHAASPGERGLTEQFDGTAAAGRHGADLGGDRLAVLYAPAARRSCQDCHMPFESVARDVSARHGALRSHRFHASDTAQPAMMQRPAEVERAADFLRSGWLRIELFALHAERGAGDAGVAADESNAEAAPFVYDIASRRPFLRPGSPVLVDVMVQNTGGGHAFPGGMAGAGQSWIEFSVIDDAGALLRRSGGLAADGRVEPAARTFSASVSPNHPAVFPPELLSAPNSEPPERIAPHGVALARYRVTPPADGTARITLRARLMWRRFNRRTTEWAFERSGRSSAAGAATAAPELPVVEICRHEVTLPIGVGEIEPATTGDDAGSLAASPADATQESPEAAANPAAPVRAARDDAAPDVGPYVRYAQGLMQEGDLDAARQALLEANRLLPRHTDVMRGLARLAVLEGRPDAAYEQLARCEEVAPSDPATAWLWGLLMQRDGRHAEAAGAFERVLQMHPDEDAAWRRLARCCFESGQHERALAAYRRVLASDATDADAFYHVMQSARALNRTEEADYAEIAYLKNRTGSPTITRHAGRALNRPSNGGMADALSSVALQPREPSPIHARVVGDPRPTDAPPGEPEDR